jgi:hypothetical protein
MQDLYAAERGVTSLEKDPAIHPRTGRRGTKTLGAMEVARLHVWRWSRHEDRSEDASMAEIGSAD